ncbi:hypothetical protein HP15_p187g52 (plasmid) [Marinobacter adhaerens HP15]|uniref:Uncharacterized protein n=1 Tax=Marinobacter adhaerens (strain DSM 23420 / HP15) TaxID=225937 RepID=E4PS14_MARAH|nr:hypothetical protein HP15_p187g52 [Marinobacter adhaerens HP15]
MGKQLSNRCYLKFSLIEKNEYFKRDGLKAVYKNLESGMK